MIPENPVRLRPTKTMNPNDRLVLGTVQLGMDYGIANRSGRPDFSNASKIVTTAWDNGIHEFDTGQAYGESEAVLGRIFHSLGLSKEAKVITKPHPDIDHLDRERMHQALTGSLKSLQCDRIDGYMLHREDALSLWDKGLREILCGFKDQGLIERIGISVYSPEKAIQALRTTEIAMIQIPGNLLDRRFERRGVFELAENLEKTIYLRSVYLQGLILMDPQNLPPSMHFMKPLLRRLETLSQSLGLSRLEMALLFVKTAYQKAKIIFGAETDKQIKANLSIWSHPIPEGLMERIRSMSEETNERILNPALW